MGLGFTQTQSRLTLSLLETHVAEYTPKTKQLEETHLSATKQLEDKQFKKKEKISPSSDEAK